ASSMRSSAIIRWRVKSCARCGCSAATSSRRARIASSGKRAAVRGACSRSHAPRAFSARTITGAIGQIVSSRSRVMARTGKFTPAFYRAQGALLLEEAGPAFEAFDLGQDDLDADQQRDREQQADDAPQPAEHHQRQ